MLIGVLADHEAAAAVFGVHATHLLFYGVFILVFSEVVDRMLTLPVVFNIVEPAGMHILVLVTAISHTLREV